MLIPLNPVLSSIYEPYVSDVLASSVPTHGTKFIIFHVQTKAIYNYTLPKIIF